MITPNDLALALEEDHPCRTRIEVDDKGITRIYVTERRTLAGRVAFVEVGHVVHALGMFNLQTLTGEWMQRAVKTIFHSERT
jgi:hypothetical protein